MNNIVDFVENCKINNEIELSKHKNKLYNLFYGSDNNTKEDFGNYIKNQLDEIFSDMNKSSQIYNNGGKYYIEILKYGEELLKELSNSKKTSKADSPNLVNESEIQKLYNEVKDYFKISIGRNYKIDDIKKIIRKNKDYNKYFEKSKETIENIMNKAKKIEAGDGNFYKFLVKILNILDEVKKEKLENEYNNKIIKIEKKIEKGKEEIKIIERMDLIKKLNSLLEDIKKNHITTNTDNIDQKLVDLKEEYRYMGSIIKNYKEYFIRNFMNKYSINEFEIKDFFEDILTKIENIEQELINNPIKVLNKHKTNYEEICKKIENEIKNYDNIIINNEKQIKENYKKIKKLQNKLNKL